MINILVVGNDKERSNNIKAQVNRFLYAESSHPLLQNTSQHTANHRVKKNDIIVLDQQLKGDWERHKSRVTMVEDAEMVYMTDAGQFCLSDIKFEYLPSFIKNFVSDDLKEALKLALDRLAFKRNYRHNLPEPNQNTDKKIIVKKENSIDILSTSDIIYIQAWGKYSLIFTLDGSKNLSGRNIGNFKKELEPSGYFQIHKSYLINANHLKKVRHENLIELTNGIFLPLARRRKWELLQHLSSGTPEINIIHFNDEKLSAHDSLK